MNDAHITQGTAGVDRSHRILLAATDGTVPTVMGGLRGLLNSGGCLVDAVGDGMQAVAVAAACPYDLILLDPVLPGCDVSATVRRIRVLPHPYGDPPILALAGLAGALDREALFAAGLDGSFPPAGALPDPLTVLAYWLAAADDPSWGLDGRPDFDLPLLNYRTLAQLEEDLGLELLPDVLQTFFRESARRLDLLESKVDAAELSAAADQAHALKGSAGTFGALALRQSVHLMEQAGRAGDQTRLTALLPEVRRLIRLTQGALQEHYAAFLGGVCAP
jgi:two-component system, sensor histidine kinase and response regulator